MQISDASFRSPADGLRIHAERWAGPVADGVVVLVHGMAEHSARYRRFGEVLTEAGFVVHALDQRGHGQSVPPGTDPGDFGAPGWDGLVQDLVAFVRRARESEPGLPLALFGHSMGSFVSQQLCFRHSELIDALVLSGSTCFDQLNGHVARLIEAGGGMSLSAFNVPFEPARTPFDWLSRDPAEVDRYVADPLCGFDLSPETAGSMGGAAAVFGDPDNLRGIRADLPVLSVAGEEDPVNDGLKGLRLLEERWRGAGVGRFDRLEYEGGRHEMLNETNRDEVTRDVIAWLRKTLGLS